MIRCIMTIGLAGALAACTLSLTPENLLVADEEYRRTDFQSLDIQNETLLPGHATLRHQWLESDIGPLALTWATQNDERANRLIIYCMGNTTDRQSDGADYLAGALPFGDAVIFDYPGYGDSAGPASLENFELALAAVANEVNRQPYDNIIIWGHSMGGFLCPRIVDRLDGNVESVVLEATFNDASTLSRFALPWYLKPFIRVMIDERFLTYNSAQTLEGFEGNIAVLAALQDKDLPIAALRNLTRRLEALGLDVRYLEFEGAGHYDIAEQPDYVARVKAALMFDQATLQAISKK